ncbi:MAG: hypothetical protein AAFZ92_02780, partial [Pseudomonadota bacterium]
MTTITGNGTPSGSFGFPSGASAAGYSAAGPSPEAQLFNAGATKRYPGSTIAAGGRLDRGVLLYSEDGSKALYLASDFNLMLLDTSAPGFDPADPVHTGTKLWDTGNHNYKHDKDNGYLIFHQNGRLQKYDRHDHGVWGAGDVNIDSSLYRLTLRNDGALIAYDGLDGRLLWMLNPKGKETNAGPAQDVNTYLNDSLGTQLESGDSMTGNQYIEADGRRIFLTHSGMLAAFNPADNKTEIILSTGIEGGTLNVGHDGRLWVENSLGKVFDIVPGTEGVDRNFTLQGKLTESSGMELSYVDETTGDILWSNRHGVIQLPVTDADLDAELTFDGRVDGNSTTLIEMESSIEAAGLIYHKLVSEIGQPPSLTALTTVDLVADTFGEKLSLTREQWLQFEQDNQLSDGRFTGAFNVRALIAGDGTGPDEEVVLKIITQASVLFNAFQHYYQHPESGLDFVWASNYQAMRGNHNRFYHALANETLGRSTTDFILSRITMDTVHTLSKDIIEKFDHDQDGIWNEAELHYYNTRHMRPDVMAVPDPGKGLLTADGLAISLHTQISKDMGRMFIDLFETDNAKAKQANKPAKWIWNGPSLADLDRSSLADRVGDNGTLADGDYSIDLITFTRMENDTLVHHQVYANADQRQVFQLDHDAGKLTILHSEKLGFNATKYYWLNHANIAYETQRTVIVDAQGNTVSGQSAKYLYAHRFARSWEHMVANGALKTESYAHLKKEEEYYNQDTESWETRPVYVNKEGTKLRDFADNFHFDIGDTYSKMTDYEAWQLVLDKMKISEEAEEFGGYMAVLGKSPPVLESTMSAAAMWGANTGSSKDIHPEFKNQDDKLKRQLENTEDIYHYLKEQAQLRGQPTDELDKEFKEIRHQLKKQIRKQHNHEMMEEIVLVATLTVAVLSMGAMAALSTAAVAGEAAAATAMAAEEAAAAAAAAEEGVATGAAAALRTSPMLYSLLPASEEAVAFADTLTEEWVAFEGAAGEAGGVAGSGTEGASEAALDAGDETANQTRAALELDLDTDHLLNIKDSLDDKAAAFSYGYKTGGLSGYMGYLSRFSSDAWEAISTLSTSVLSLTGGAPVAGSGTVYIDGGSSTGEGDSEPTTRPAFTLPAGFAHFDGHSVADALTAIDLQAELAQAYNNSPQAAVAVYNQRLEDADNPDMPGITPAIVDLALDALPDGMGEIIKTLASLDPAMLAPITIAPDADPKEALMALAIDNVQAGDNTLALDLLGVLSKEDGHAMVMYLAGSKRWDLTTPLANTRDAERLAAGLMLEAINKAVDEADHGYYNRLIDISLFSSSYTTAIFEAMTDLDADTTGTFIAEMMSRRPEKIGTFTYWFNELKPGSALKLIGVIIGFANQQPDSIAPGQIQDLEDMAKRLIEDGAVTPAEAFTLMAMPDAAAFFSTLTPTNRTRQAWDALSAYASALGNGTSIKQAYTAFTDAPVVDSPAFTGLSAAEKLALLLLLTPEKFKGAFNKMTEDAKGDVLGVATPHAVVAMLIHMKPSDADAIVDTYVADTHPVAKAWAALVRLNELLHGQGQAGSKKTRSNTSTKGLATPGETYAAFLAFIKGDDGDHTRIKGKFDALSATEQGALLGSLAREDLHDYLRSDLELVTNISTLKAIDSIDPNLLMNAVFAGEAHEAQSIINNL